MAATPVQLCPRCHSTDFRRSHRKNMIERLLSVTFLPYRCLRCDHRFFVARWKMPIEAAEPDDQVQTRSAAS